MNKFTRIILSAFFLGCLVILNSCAGNQYYEENFFCMDTYATIKISEQDKTIIKKCRDLLSSLDDQLSRHKDESVTSKFNSSKDGCEITEDVKNLIELGNTISSNTNGYFSIFSGSLTSLWSEAEQYPSEQSIQKALKAMTDGSTLEKTYLKKQNSDTKLEFGGIAKGYACDKTVALLKENGVQSGMITFSSSISVFGQNPDGKSWNVAIKNPLDTNKIQGVLTLADTSLSVSGDYERFFEIGKEKYNHILDTKSGLPVDNGVHSVAVVTQSGALADALSTAFFALGYEKTNELYGSDNSIKYLFITDEGVFMNEGMKQIYKAN